MSVRTVRPSDFAALYRLDAERADAVRRPRPTEAERRGFWLDDGGLERDRLVVVDSGDIAAFGSITFLKATAAIDGYTSCSRRGRGHGSALMEQLLAAARGRPTVEHATATGYFEDDACTLLVEHGFALTTARWEMEYTRRSSIAPPSREVLLSRTQPPFTTLYREVFAAVFSADELPDQSAFADTVRFEQFCIYAGAGDRVVGFCHGELDRERLTGTLLWLGVTSNIRREGVGRALLRATGRELARRGAQTIRVGVDADNKPAVRLYRSEGFTRTGVQRSYELVMR